MSEKTRQDIELNAESEEPMEELETETAEPRSRSRRKRWIAAIAGAAVIAIVAVFVMTSGAGDADAVQADAETEEGDDAAPVPVEVIVAAQGTVAAYVSATANLVAENDVSVLSEVEGRVTALTVDEGHYVQSGQVLARLDSSDEQIAFKKAELRHANAKLAYQRSQDLMEKELISREESDKLTVDYQIADQELAESQWALDQTVVKSPFAGRVTLREIQLGQHIRPGDSLFQITDFDPLIARIYLSEGDIVGLAPGTEARIQLNASPDVALRGRIRQISPVVDTATGTVKVTVEAVEPSAEIRPGSFVSVHIVRETHSDALLVPREAVLRELQSSHVFVTAGETATKRAISLGIEESGQVQVLGGLEAGEQVIVAGQGGLREGARVRILGEQPDESDDEVVADAINVTEAG